MSRIPLRARPRRRRGRRRCGHRQLPGHSDHSSVPIIAAIAVTARSPSTTMSHGSPLLLAASKMRRRDDTTWFPSRMLQRRESGNVSTHCLGFLRDAVRGCPVLTGLMLCV